VLRSYDSRFRKTERSPVIYRDEKCEDIVGGPVEVVLESPAERSKEKEDRGVDPPWTNTCAIQLQIIAFPYKEGNHYASKPTDFIPIIEQLIKLHKLGYVHGDIRGYNVVFGDKSGLIDFDFGGIAGIGTYPQGYRQDLRDGCRLGNGDAARADHILEAFQDWFAFGKLMFSVHDWKAPLYSTLDADSRLRFFETSSKWNKLESQPLSDDLEILKDDLRFFDKHWTVRPTTIFAEELALFKSQERMDTYGGATGSPQPMGNG
jgi:hypothetical protein